MSALLAGAICGYLSQSVWILSTQIYQCVENPGVIV